MGDRSCLNQRLEQAKAGWPRRRGSCRGASDRGPVAFAALHAPERDTRQSDGRSSPRCSATTIDSVRTSRSPGLILAAISGPFSSRPRTFVGRRRCREADRGEMVRFVGVASRRQVGRLGTKPACGDGSSRTGRPFPACRDWDRLPDRLPSAPTACRSACSDRR
jgi:hypothetical protein